MTQKIRITSVRNAHGCKIRKCCASCQHKCIESDGSHYALLPTGNRPDRGTLGLHNYWKVVDYRM